MGSRSGSRSNSGIGMTMLKGTGVVVAGGSLAFNFVQASEINDLNRALERECANRTVLLQGIAGPNQEPPLHQRRAQGDLHWRQSA